MVRGVILSSPQPPTFSMALNALVFALDWWPSKAQMKYGYHDWLRFGNTGRTPQEYFNNAEACIRLMFDCGFIDEWEVRSFASDGGYNRPVIRAFGESHSQDVLVFEGEHEKQRCTIVCRPCYTYRGCMRFGPLWRSPHTYLSLPIRCWLIRPRELYNKIYRRGRWEGPVVMDHPPRAPLTEEEEKYGRRYDDTPWDYEIDDVDTVFTVPKLVRREALGSNKMVSFLRRAPPPLFNPCKHADPKLSVVQELIDRMEPLLEYTELQEKKEEPMSEEAKQMADGFFA